MALVKRLENPITVPRADSGAIVANVEDPVVTVSCRPKQYRAGRGRELERIRQQIVENQRHLAAICKDRKVLKLKCDRLLCRRDRQAVAVDHRARQ
jgi:hypothetical protein